MFIKCRGCDHRPPGSLPPAFPPAVPPISGSGSSSIRSQNLSFNYGILDLKAPKMPFSSKLTFSLESNGQMQDQALIKLKRTPGVEKTISKKKRGKYACKKIRKAFKKALK